MKWVKIYEDYSEIKKICDRYDIKNWTLNSNGEIDVDGDVNLCDKNLTKLPLNFGTIRGYFHCNYNQLISLDGAPKIVKGNFNCNDNQLTSLMGSPKTITDNFYCNWNRIRSFEGAPMYVDGYFRCGNNPIYPIWCLFQDWSKVEFLNDCDAIQDWNIIMDRLNYFLGEITKGEYRSLSEAMIADLEARGYKIIY